MRIETLGSNMAESVPHTGNQQHTTLTSEDEHTHTSATTCSHLCFHTHAAFMHQEPRGIRCLVRDHLDIGLGLGQKVLLCCYSSSHSEVQPFGGRSVVGLWVLLLFQFSGRTMANLCTWCHVALLPYTQQRHLSRVFHDVFHLHGRLDA